MKSRIVLSYILLIGVMVGFLGLYLFGSNQLLYTNIFEQDTRREIELLGDLVAANNTDLQAFADTYGTHGLRVTVISVDGQVLADSADLPISESHAGRPEVEQALQSGYGSAQRVSDTTRESYYYAAELEQLPQGPVILRVAKPMHFVEEVMNQITVIALVGMAVCAAVAVGSAIYLTRHVTRPLKRLGAAVAEVSAGRYGREIDLGEETGEIADLADSFNAMNKILEYNVTQLSAQNSRLHAMLNSMTEAVVAVDNSSRILLTNPAAHRMLGIEESCVGRPILAVTKSESLGRLIDRVRKKKKQKTREIRLHFDTPQILRVGVTPITDKDGAVIGEMLVAEDVTQIRRLEQMRTDFVSNVSHELKTPLTSIIGFVDTLKAGAINDPAVASRFLDIIGQESDRLYSLIQDILTLSSIETAETDSGMQPTDLTQLARRVEELLAARAEKKGLRFVFSVQPGLPAFTCNGDRIYQMMLNLCDNAVKYTEKGGVEAALFQEGEDLVLTVCDTGIGIPEDACDRVFERFYRVDKGRSRDMGGTGLGLSIVKHIVLLYGGVVSVASRVGEGTTFTVRLPYNPL